MNIAQCVLQRPAVSAEHHVPKFTDWLELIQFLYGLKIVSRWRQKAIDICFEELEAPRDTALKIRVFDAQFLVTTIWSDT